MSIQANELDHKIKNKTLQTNTEWIPLIEKNKINCTTIAITSGKGGVGKTNFSLNFALSLKQINKEVLLVDADLGLANIDILLGITPNLTLSKYFSDNLSLKDIIYKGPERLNILPAKNGLENIANLSENQLIKFIKDFSELELYYDYIIFDTSAGIRIQTTSFVLSSKECFVLITPEPTSIVDAYSMIKIIVKKQPAKTINIIVNMAKSEQEAITTFNNVAELAKKFLKKTLFFYGYLPYDNDVIKAVKSQVPVLQLNNNSKFSKNLLSIRDNWLSKQNFNKKISFGERFVKFFKNTKDLI